MTHYYFGSFVKVKDDSLRMLQSYVGDNNEDIFNIRFEIPRHRSQVLGLTVVFPFFVINYFINRPKVRVTTKESLYLYI